MKEFDRHIALLEDRLGLTFDDKDLLLQAFTHRSYLNENRREQAEHNELLEFLGDAVIELAVTEFLYRNFGGQTEGVLTDLRAELVSTQALNQVARELDVLEFVRTSHGERKELERHEKRRERMRANLMEAIVGALYLDRGFSATQLFILDTIIPKVQRVMEIGSTDWKSRLQELTQERLSQTPRYRVLSEDGPEHDRVYTVGVLIGQYCVATGSGTSKKEAEKDAAQRAFKNYSK